MPQLEHRLLFKARQHNIPTGNRTIAQHTPKHVKSSCSTPILVKDKRDTLLKIVTEPSAYHALPTSRTTTDHQNFGWNVYNRTLSGTIHWWGCSDRLSGYICLLMRIRIWRRSRCMLGYATYNCKIRSIDLVTYYSQPRKVDSPEVLIQ